MVRVDVRYVIPANRDVVWGYLTDPTKEALYGWNLHGGANEVLERSDHHVKFRGGRDRTLVDRKSFWSTFEGRFEKTAWRIRWRIVDGFEAGSEYVEELLEHPQGTQVHTHGVIRLRNVDWDQRLQALVAPGKARALIERNIARDYKRLKEHLAKEIPA